MKKLGTIHQALGLNKLNAYRYIKWAFIHTALILFFADFIAAVWPAFDHVWEGHAKIAVGIAALTAAIAEFINSWMEDKEEDDHMQRITDLGQDALASVPEIKDGML